MLEIAQEIAVNIMDRLLFFLHYWDYGRMECKSRPTQISIAIVNHAYNYENGSGNCIMEAEVNARRVV